MFEDLDLLRASARGLGAGSGLPRAASSVRDAASAIKRCVERLHRRHVAGCHNLLYRFGNFLAQFLFDRSHEMTVATF